MRHQQEKPIVSAATALVVAMSLAIAINCSGTARASSSLHNTDCMRNPFASGCRGISAKRSSLAPQQLPPAADIWRQAFDSTSSDTDDNNSSGMYKELATNFVHDLASAGPKLPKAKSRQTQVVAEARRVFSAVETLIESASGMVSLCVELELAQQQSLGGPRTSCREVFAAHQAAMSPKKRTGDYLKAAGPVRGAGGGLTKEEAGTGSAIE